jgi:hypothetical protein
VPSSMIFVSLVVLWLLILVPAVARHRQEVARPSVAALSGRVLERPRQRQVPGQGPAAGREREVDGMDDDTGEDSRIDEHDDVSARTVDEHDDRRWERPPPRYRPGRGGFDPEAAALAARARYAFRQRVVLAMLIIALGTGVIAAVGVPGMWWPHGAVDLALVGYLVYLRRQVRLEEAIRERRAARMAGTRRTAAADDPDLDDWARRGREAVRHDAHERRPAPEDDHDLDHEYDDYDDATDDGLDDEVLDDGALDEGVLDDGVLDDGVLDDGDPERGPGSGAWLRDRRARDERDRPEPVDAEPALPRLRPNPPPALPAGTSLVEADEDDLELYELDGPARPGYQRAAGE